MTNNSKVLITSALPYINGIKHLGNLAGSLLPADIHARYRRQIGDEVLFICATDEHGTPAELAAAEAGLPVAEYCAEQHRIQADIYRRFCLSFDHFGRSSSPQNRALTQHFFKRLDERGFIEERTLRQVYSHDDARFLPDRYILGTCPQCGFDRARGDQCEECSRLLEPTDLIQPRSAISGSTNLEVRPTKHFFLRQRALVGALETWLASRQGWPHLVTSIARKWLDEGIQDRCITRDLAWGVPIPKDGFEGKVFYVWFDAPIEYIAATQEWADVDPQKRDWKAWWWQADDVEYLQFLGKDNVPFHAVSFPCTVLGAGEPWKTVDVIKGVSWLTYEGQKFSTSQRRGVFLDQALDLLPADYWRWWLAANAPESRDSAFSFERFAAGVNNDLADTFGNLVNRVLKFVATKYDGIVPTAGETGDLEQSLVLELIQRLATLKAHQDERALRKAADEVRAIWSAINTYLVAAAPWSKVAREPDRAAIIIRTSVNLVALAATIAWPFIPTASEHVLEALGHFGQPSWPSSVAEALTLIQGGKRVGVPPILFEKLSAEWVETNRAKFADAKGEHDAVWSR
ncbi:MULTISPECIES: methionine--tRNA ligase [unclassified Beijerinckia]|uniref:methionine--tRNA ligase n=1 Tax=unclassified Beijerinckia TaxID=2638183 RepID=UPI000898E34A|nr:MULTISPECIES: methionine--tRNA ligase [unclassified Beijerinckia]MDH7796255.1 methionyl-tRNA synthetase [Beijerinckia sp. GAS462]SEC37137.1 methionyl-tRNA synthetase [Beijerinckia sp. 28-YEA-48]